MLGHLEAGDLVVATVRDGNVSVVHTKDLALLLGDADLAKRTVAPDGLVAAEGDASDAGAVVLACETSESAPAAADVEHALILLQTDLLADHGQLIVLELLQGLLSVDVGDDTGGVDHAGPEKPAVEVVAAVVVVADLLLI